MRSETLKAEIAKHLITIRLLETRSRRTQQSKGILGGRFQSSDSLSACRSEALLQLGHSVVETGAIPKTPISRPPNQRHREDGPQPQRTGTSDPPPTATDNIHRSPTPSLKSDVGSDASSLSFERAWTVPGYESERSSVVLSRRQKSNYEIGIGEQVVASTLHINTEGFTTGTTGYIKTSEGTLTRIIAKVAEDLERNLISIVEARRLDLEVQPVEPGEKVSVDFGGTTKEQTIGTVAFLWRKSPEETGHPPPLRIQCGVCESSQLSLVFGRPFLEAKSRYWPGGNT